MSTYRYICVLLISLLALTARANDDDVPTEQAPIFGGVAVYADLVGPALKVFGNSHSNLEAGARLNFKEKYFPVAELGIGTCEREGADNANVFKTTAPFFRAGLDYNFNKKISGNRLFVGFRYALSNFKFDVTNAEFRDPVWNNQRPLQVMDQSSTCQWLELVVGMETKLWSIVRLGYTIRMKFMMSMSGDEMGEPYYIPGFGRNGQPFGGTFYVAFDVGKSARSAKKAKQKTNVNVQQ